MDWTGNTRSSGGALACELLTSEDADGYWFLGGNMKMEGGPERRQEEDWHKNNCIFPEQN